VIEKTSVLRLIKKNELKFLRFIHDKDLSNETASFSKSKLGCNWFHYEAIVTDEQEKLFYAFSDILCYDE